MTLLERVNEKRNQGYRNEIAELIVGQEIIIEAISLSDLKREVVTL